MSRDRSSPIPNLNNNLGTYQYIIAILGKVIFKNPRDISMASNLVHLLHYLSDLMSVDKHTLAIFYTSFAFVGVLGLIWYTSRETEEEKVAERRRMR